MEPPVPHPSTTRTRRSFAPSPISRRDPLPRASLQEAPIRAQLERICGSRVFSEAHRSQLFLRYVVERFLARPDDPIKEYSIALDVFDRDASYDPAVNNTVRVEAGRLRSRLLEYYANEGHADSLLIEVPRGGYRALIRPRHSTTALISPAAALAAARPSPAGSLHLRHLWAIPVAFVIGALLGYRASH